MKLTPHFSLEELTRSSTAARLGIDNTPSEEVLHNLQETAERMEILRKLLGVYSSPIYVDSGYRSPELNKAVGGSKTSAHLTGLAVDFVCPSVGTPKEIVQVLARSGLQFDQLIQEGTWVHVSFDPRMRGQVLTARFGASGVTYTVGV